MSFAIHPFKITTHDLTCPVCLQKYDPTNYQPLCLPCGHNLCSKCVLKMVFCPICREYIHNRADLGKNLLICNLIESQKKVTECKHHNKPLEFFCKEHNCILCVDCGFKGGHFSHEIIHIQEIEKRLGDTKGMITEISKKNERSKESFQKFLHDQSKNIKRGIDEMFDEYLGPLMAIKKKIHKEFDTFAISQSEEFNKNFENQEVIQWKEKNKGLVKDWGTKKEGNIANQLLNNRRQKIEKKLKTTHFEDELERFEGITKELMEQTVKTLRDSVKPLSDFSKINALVEKKIKKSSKIEARHLDQEEEIKNLTEYLREFGIPASYFEEDNEKIIEIKGEVKEIEPSNAKQKYFECQIWKLRVSLKDVSASVIKTILKVLSSSLIAPNLTDLKIWFVNVIEGDAFTFVQNLTKFKSLEHFSFYISHKDPYTRNVLPDLWHSLSKLSHLKTLSITLDRQRVDKDHGEFDLIPLKEVQEVDLCFMNCDKLTLKELPGILESLENSKKLVKLSFILAGCEKKVYEKSFESLKSIIPKMTQLRDLTIAFENTSQPPEILLNFPGSIEKLAISYMGTEQAVSLQEYIKHISQELPDLKHLTIDWSNTSGSFSSWPNVFGTYLCKLEKLSSFDLTMKGCGLEPQFIETLFLHYLSSLVNLKFLLVDLRENGLKTLQSNSQIQEAFDRLPGSIEKCLFMDQLAQGIPSLSSSSPNFDEGNRGFYEFSSSSSSSSLHSPLNEFIYN